jgi:hypothetical protein
MAMVIKVATLDPQDLRASATTVERLGTEKWNAVHRNKRTNERANAAVDGRNNGRRKQDQDDMVLMAVDVDDYDFCPMAIDSVTTQDSHEIQGSFFDRFTYESDNDYDDSYDSTPFDDKEYDILSMITDLDELQEQVTNGV